VALEKGVAVSIISIKGTNTSLEHIAKVSADTRGYNDIVDPLNLTKNFNFVLQNSIIATDVSATMYLNRGLTFRHEKNAQNTKATRVIGNCTKESAITFEYYPAERDVVKDLKHVLFQVQINFTKLDGTKCMRITSKMAEVTQKREEAEKNVNVNVVGLHSQAQAAQLATEGQYTKARMIQKTNMRMVRRTLASSQATEKQATHYDLWNKEALRLNSAIKSTKIAEKKEGLSYHSAEEDESDDEGYDHRIDDRNDEEEEKEKEKEKEKKKVEKKEKEEKLEKEEANFQKLKKLQVEQAKLKKVKKLQVEQDRKQRRTKNDHVSNAIYQAQNPLYSAYSTASNPLYKKE